MISRKQKIQRVQQSRFESGARLSTPLAPALVVFYFQIHLITSDDPGRRESGYKTALRTKNSAYFYGHHTDTWRMLH